MKIYVPVIAFILLLISSCATRYNPGTGCSNLSDIFDIADSETIKDFQKKMRSMGFNHKKTDQHPVLNVGVYKYERLVRSGGYQVAEVIDFFLTQAGGTTKLETNQAGSADYLSFFHTLLTQAGYIVKPDKSTPESVNLWKGQNHVVLKSNPRINNPTFIMEIHYRGEKYSPTY